MCMIAAVGEILDSAVNWLSSQYSGGVVHGPCEELQ